MSVIQNKTMENKVTVNVSGTKFEMLESTWAKIKEQMPETSHREVHQFSDECFFERHSGTFEAILYYFQGGQLHMPGSLCPSSFKKELEFWGIQPSELNKCCFSKYVNAFDDESVLKILEDDEIRRVHQTETLLQMVTQRGWRAIQGQTWLTLEEPMYSLAAKIYFILSAIVIVVSLFFLVAGTHEDFQRELTVDEWKTYFGDDFDDYAHLFAVGNNATSTLPAHVHAREHYIDIIELVTLSLFTIDLIIRLIFCPFRKQLVFSFLIWVDVLSLAVTYIKLIVEAAVPTERYEHSVLDILHCLQIIRVFRLFRLVKNFTGFRVLVYAFRASAKEMGLMVLFLFVAMLIFSSFVFYSGDDNFPSIPDAFWWAIVTMTTVGYGDMVPKTGLSKLIGAVCAMAGVCLIAVVIPIFVNNFMLFYAYSKVWGDKDILAQRDKKKNKQPSLTIVRSKVECYN